MPKFDSKQNDSVGFGPFSEIVARNIEEWQRSQTEELWGALPVLVLMGDDVQLLTACVQH